MEGAARGGSRVSDVRQGGGTGLKRALTAVELMAQHGSRKHPSSQSRPGRRGFHARGKPYIITPLFLSPARRIV